MFTKNNNILQVQTKVYMISHLELILKQLRITERRYQSGVLN